MTDLDIPETGAVFTFGKSRFAENKPSHFFIKNDPVVQISCGDEHTAVICKNGRIFAFGSNEWGQLGLGHNNMIHKPSCIKTLKPEKAKYIACGRAHTIILTESNNVYACGSNTDGQLGLENLDIVNNPTKIQHPSLTENGIIKKLSAGSQHSVALTESGKLFVWGSNSEGQLGLESKKTNCRVPTQLDFKDKIKEVSCGYYHTAVITENGELYTFGENENGKLGLPVTDNQTYRPTRVQTEARVATVACGGNHNLCITDAGDVLVFGSNVFGELGLDKQLTWVNPPRQLPSHLFADESIRAVACGENHTAFLTESNKIYTCGDSRHGKLCQDEVLEELQYAPRVVSRFQNYKVNFVSCGGCHTILSAERFAEEPILPPLQRIPNALLADDTKIKEDMKELTAITSTMDAECAENGLHDSSDALIDEALKEIDDAKTNVSELKLPEEITEKIITQSEELKKEFEKVMADDKLMGLADEIDVKETVNGLDEGADFLDDLGDTVRVGAENVTSVEIQKLKDFVKDEKKYDSVDNLLQEIEDDLSGTSGTATSSDTVSVRSVEKKTPEKVIENAETKPEIKPTEDEEDLKIEEPLQPTEKRISKFLKTFRRKKISATEDNKLDETIKDEINSAEAIKEDELQKTDKSKACTIL